MRTDWYGIAASILLLGLPASAQTIVPALDRINDATVWRVVNRRATVHQEGDRRFVRLDEGTGSGDAWLIGSDFKEGTIEVDLRGKNIQGESFVGIAFRGADDNTRDVVYF